MNVTRGSYVHKPVVKFLVASSNIDGLRPKKTTHKALRIHKILGSEKSGNPRKCGKLSCLQIKRKYKEKYTVSFEKGSSHPKSVLQHLFQHFEFVSRDGIGVHKLLPVRNWDGVDKRFVPDSKECWEG